jgi:enterochelin esterase-like enzyme
LTDLFGNEIRNDWIINQYIRVDKKKIKLFLDWGLQENMVLGANRKMVRILDKKGYDFKFVEFNGWHDWSNSRKTFPVGLMYLLKD